MIDDLHYKYGSFFIINHDDCIEVHSSMCNICFMICFMICLLCYSFANLIQSFNMDGVL